MNTIAMCGQCLGHGISNNWMSKVEQYRMQLDTGVQLEIVGDTEYLGIQNTTGGIQCTNHIKSYNHGIFTTMDFQLGNEDNKIHLHNVGYRLVIVNGTWELEVEHELTAASKRMVGGTVNNL